MKTQKTIRIIEILQLILNYLNSKDYGFKYDDNCYNSYGLRGIIRYMLFINQITEEEYYSIIDYLRANKPYTTSYFCGFWWQREETQPRIEFINNLISTLKNETK